MNYDKLRELIECVPDGLDKKIKKEPINAEIREAVHGRDGNTCVICGRINEMHIHHIIPNGKASLDNLISLCVHCHVVVHKLLFVSGKWRHVSFNNSWKF